MDRIRTESARNVDRIGFRWDGAGMPADFSPVKLNQSMLPEKAINLLDGLSPEQIFVSLVLESNLGKDFNFAHLLDKLLKITKSLKRMSDYSMVARCQKQIRDIVYEQTGKERFENLKLKMKEFAPQLQDLTADLVKEAQIDLKTL